MNNPEAAAERFHRIIIEEEATEAADAVASLAGEELDLTKSLLMKIQI